MKKFIVSIAAVGLLAGAAAPVMAQDYGHRGPDRPQSNERYDRHDDRGGYDRHDDRASFDLRSKVSNVVSRANRALASGRLTRGERQSISYRSNKLSALLNRYERGGITRAERNDIERNVAELDRGIDRTRFNDRMGYGYRR